MTNLGRCSKHRHIREFKEGDKVRILTWAGRRKPNSTCEDGDIGVVAFAAPFREAQQVDIYERSKERIWGGTVAVKFGSGIYYLSPRAMEKISQ